MRSYIISLLPGSPDVRDVLQEVNIVLWEKMNDFGLSLSMLSRSGDLYLLLAGRWAGRWAGFFAGR